MFVTWLTMVLVPVIGGMMIEGRLLPQLLMNYPKVLIGITTIHLLCVTTWTLWLETFIALLSLIPYFYVIARQFRNPM